MADCCKRAACTWTALAAALIGWIIYIAGTGSLHYACWQADLPWAARQVMSYASSLVPFTSCAWTYGWYWFLVFMDLGILVIIVVVLAVPALRPARLGCMALLAIVTTLLIDSGRTFLNIHYELPEGTLIDATDTYDVPLTSRAAKAAVAGAILVSVCNLLLCLALGYCPNSATAGPTCCASSKREEPPTDAPAATAQAFLSAVQSKNSAPPPV